MKSTSRADKAAFHAFIDQAVADTLRSGVTTFATLLRALPAVYPTEALASLDRLNDAGFIADDVLLRLRQQASSRRVERPEGRSLLPLPHPLNFEWRFTADASRDLLNTATALTQPHARILMFGTPGLAVEAISLPTNRHLAFLGEDNAVTRRLMNLNKATGAPLSIAFCTGGLPRDSADAVLLDPPWYNDFIRPMLAAAATACRSDGVVLVSLPPIGTRATAEADREVAKRFAARLGLEPVDECPLSIAYDTPFFEANALAAVGLFAPARWRRGDLVIFRKTRRSTRPATVTTRRPIWIEVAVGRMRVFIKPDPMHGGGLSGLIPLIPDDVLPSVSRRDMRRRGAQVWTSGNRVFQTDNVSLVLEAALACDGAQFGAGIQGRLWGTVAERDAIERVGHELRGLATLEAAEERGSPILTADRSGLWTSSSINSYSKLTATVSG